MIFRSPLIHVEVDSKFTLSLYQNTLIFELRKQGIDQYLGFTSVTFPAC
jgi:hypothetical protein